MCDVLREEGCPKSEIHFKPNDLCIVLDAIQKRTAQRRHTSPQASADLLLCVKKHRILLADAKFNCKTVKNIERKEIVDKRTASRAVIADDGYQMLQDFYLLFKTSILSPMAKDYLKRTFNNSPILHFVTAIEFAGQFEDKNR